MRINVWREDFSYDWGSWSEWCMYGNEHLRFLRWDDWALVYVDPEGVEWHTLERNDPLLGRVTVECDPYWLDIDESLGVDVDDPDYLVGEHDDTHLDLYRQFVDRNIRSYIFSHVIEEPD